VCFMAARAAAAPEARTGGLQALAKPLTGYASTETHTWISKAVDLCGLGSAAIRKIPVDAEYRMSAEQLEAQLEQDIASDFKPFIVVATAGTVATGAIDPIPQIAELCRRHGVWLHVDGAYGAPAAMLPDASPELKAIRAADSIAIDPHKWLYAPMEAGAALVRDPNALRDAFAYRPPYYKFEGSADDPRVNFYELGPQNSRGFRALKVWLALRNIGRAGYEQSIAQDIALSRLMFDTAAAHPELEALTQNLSIATFRYVPADLHARREESDVAAYLNELNTALVGELQTGGEVFLSNAVLDGRYALRACIVNFRTTADDAVKTPEIAVRVGRALDEKLRPMAPVRT
jgi:aromatic-L-amino-acid decarboxylase